MEHLSLNAKEYINRSDDERIYKIQSERWIGYTRANTILRKLDDLIKYPECLRMPNLLIVGDTNNGKTVLVNRFYNSHKPVVIPGDERLIASVVYVQAPPQPDERAFYNALLDELNAPFKLSDKVERKQQQAIHILRRIETKVLIIDEIHNILAGSLSKQRIFLNVLKYLANELRICIVAVGTRDAFNAINTDSQISNRFEPIVLPRWQMNEEYLRLLASLEHILPLKHPSNLIDTDIALKILSMSEGTIGEISKVVSLSAIDAIREKKEYIDKKIIENIDYKSPSERKRYSERIF